MVARSLLKKASSLPSSRSFLILGVTWPGSSKTSSKCLPPFRRLWAVLAPIPLTPGMLSEGSPLRPISSITWSGLRPSSSKTSLGPYSTSSLMPFLGRATIISSFTSWRISLSPVRITDFMPWSWACFVRVPIRSSAS